LRDVVEAADERPVCAVIEATQLTREEITMACKLVLDSGAEAVATGTDFWPDRQASEADVKLLRETAGPDFILKAAGGIGDAQTVLALLDAGATRIGTTGAPGFRQFSQSQAG
jgi:deoxyribose-phosphate aldolase